MNTIFINDKFTKARGGYSELLNIHCRKCDAQICTYQKDGPGDLLRMYDDRIIKSDGFQKFVIDKKLICPSCGKNIGPGYIYKPENRNAYALFMGAVKKKPVSRIRHIKCLLRNIF